jgi:exosortase
LAAFLAAHRRALLGLAALSAIILWSYWPTLVTMGEKWFTDPQYSHGFLVPMFAVVLLWLRRARIETAEFTTSPLGLLGVGLGLALHLIGGRYSLEWLDMVSLLPVLAGLCWCFGGKTALAWAWPSIAFLAFMLPLPYRVETALSFPLRRLATSASTYVLQTLGFPAVSEGNIIIIDDARVGVVEACNGLGALFTFFAITTALVIVLQRRWLDQVIIILSAIPIALFANVVRIVVSAMLASLVGQEAAQVFHNSAWAGLLMMSVAVGLLWLELWILSRLLLEPVMTAFHESFLGKAGRGKTPSATPA